MSEAVNPVSSNISQIPPPVDPAQQAKNPAVVQAVGGEAALTGASKIGSMGELQKKAPALYKAILMGIAMRIKSEQESFIRRFKDAQRKMRE